MASFFGLVPAKSPDLCISVVVDEPDGSFFGGDAAAPVFARIAQKAVERLGIPTDKLSNCLPAAADKVGEQR